MSNVAYQFTAQFTIVECYKCGVLFGVPRDLNQKHQESGAGFFCVNGHEQFYCKSEVQKLREQLETEQRRVTFANQRREEAERSAAAARGHVTKLQRRIAAGVCPCCHRRVAQLAAHMKTKHPDFPKVDGARREE